MGTGERGGRLVLDAPGVGKAIDSIVARLAAAMGQDGRLALVGIRRRGVPLAERLCRGLSARTGLVYTTGSLDITLYRDDLSLVGPRAVAHGTDITWSVDDRPILLVDDVLYTGRTIRAAIDQIMDLGRPARIALAVLVDRGHRELPIQADVVGHRVRTDLDEDIIVHLVETDGGVDEVLARRMDRVEP